jgi:hypothetical protein
VGGWGDIEQHIVLSALYAGKWTTSRFGRFISVKRAVIPIYRRLCGPQRRSGCDGEQNKIMNGKLVRIWKEFVEEFKVFACGD